MPPKTKKSTSKTATTPCDLCCIALKDGEDTLCCSGPCKSQVHRYCAAVTVSHFRSLQANSSPFTCLFCTQAAFKTTVECLQSEIVKLRADVDRLKEAPEASCERQEAAPRARSTNYSRAATQPNQTKRSQRKKPPSSSSTSSTSGSSLLPGSSSVPGPSSSHVGVGEPVPSDCTSTRPRARTKVDGARRIWGTMNQTSVKTVQNAISRFCKMDGLSIKRKTKTGTSKSSWWFVVHADEKVLCDLESKWDEIHLHTSWMLQICSKPDNNPINGPVNVHVNNCSASAAIDQLESPPSSSPSTSITLSSDSHSVDDPSSDPVHPTTGSQSTDAIPSEQNGTSQHCDPFRGVHQEAAPPYTQ